MGGSETKIVHETIDRTDPKAQEKGMQAAAAENAQRIAELEEQLKQQETQQMADALERVRIQNETDANKREAEKRRVAEQERKREEQEKLTKDTLMCEKMKEELMNYKFGNKLTTKAFEREQIDISDMSRVVIALFGPTGSGKTSFIGTMERILLGKKSQTAYEQGAGGEGTILLQEYLSGLKVNLLDTRGFFHANENTFHELLNIMTGRTKQSDEIARDEDNEAKLAEYTGPMAKFCNRVHAVIFVIKAKDTRLKDGLYMDRLKQIRDHFRYEGISPITVITCEDEIKNDEERQRAFREASAATGSPLDRTFFIANYTKDHYKYSLDTEKKAVNIVDTALLSVERYVKIQKLREKHHGNEEETAIHEFFKKNQAAYGWNSERVESIVKQLEDMGVVTVESLKESWDDVKQDIKMTIGIRSGLQEALKKN